MLYYIKITGIKIAHTESNLEAYYANKLLNIR